MTEPIPGPAELATPYLLVDVALLDRRVAQLAAWAQDRGLALRPHAKTHKSIEIARRQLDAGATGLTVATVAEAEVFAAAGCTDLFVGYPLWVDAARGHRLRALAGSCTLSLGIDSVDGAAALASQLPGATVLVEVDSGQHRTGVPPERAGELAAAAAGLGLDVAGVFTFPGHSYAVGAGARVADQEAAALGTAVAGMGSAGIRARVVSGGSTPSVDSAHPDLLTEVRPGVYVFGDAQQWELGTTTPDLIALTCVATVVSHAGGRVVLDAGSKVLGADRAGYATGWGRLPDHPEARVELLAEHHAVVTWDQTRRPALGSRVRVAPNHVCTAVNLADQLHTTTGERWRVDARGANT